MRMVMISCSKTGYELMHRLKKDWLSVHAEDEITTAVKAKGIETEDAISGTIAEYVGNCFAKVDAIVFLCAAGIAVRCIAPYLVHKSQDPAVVVIDETAKYCISLVSGHAGGANFLATELAGRLGAEPVITTATDREGRFAIDEFARKNHLILTNWQLAKEISAGILNNQSLAIRAVLAADDTKLSQAHPSDAKSEEKKLRNTKLGDETRLLRVIQGEKEPADFVAVITPYRSLPTDASGALRLIPQNVCLGIGCKKGATMKQVEAAVMQACEEAGIDRRAISRVASIDLKKDEPGLLEYCKMHHLPFETYSAEELSRLEGNFTESEFVKKVTGVGNVCERSAVLSGGGKLIFGKHAYDGVTVAMTWKMEELKFE